MNRRILFLLTATVALALAGCSGGPWRSAAGQNPAAPPAPPVHVDARPVLADALATGADPIKAMVLETFLEAHQPAPAVDLRAPLNPRVRMLAYVAAAQRRDSEAVPFFRAGLRDADPAVRLASAYGLTMMGDGSQATVLRDGLSSPDVTVRRNAAWMIGLMDNASAVDMLKTKLDDPDAVVVLRVAEALFRLGSSDGLEQVRLLTEHERHVVRYFATRLLGRIGAKDDIPRLQKLSESRFLDVKFAAVGALAQQGDFKRIELLVEFLESPEPASRLLAARELGETGYTPAGPALARPMARSDPMERTTAASSILRIQAETRSWRGHAQVETKPRNLSPDDLPKLVAPLPAGR